jgi:hypothetical protein
MWTVYIRGGVPVLLRDTCRFRGALSYLLHQKNSSILITPRTHPLLLNRLQRPPERLHQLPRIFQPHTKPYQIRFDAPFRTLSPLLATALNLLLKIETTYPIEFSIMRQNHIRRAQREIRA